MEYKIIIQNMNFLQDNITLYLVFKLYNVNKIKYYLTALINCYTLK